MVDETRDIVTLTASIDVLAERIDNLISLNRDIIRWLMIVVCVIALGRSGFDAVKDIWGHNPSVASVVVK